MIDGADALNLHIVTATAERSLNTRIASAVEEAKRFLLDIDTDWLGVEEVHVMHVIRFANRATLIAEVLQKATPTISHIITRLRDNGMIERVRDPNDGRAYNLALTHKGMRVMNEVLDLIEGINAPDATVKAAERLAKRVR